ncbi:MAG: DUF4440 domain-containing protein [Planctomycetales bacterium]|nr:DUF4440 domain-containing protein [Planctomycetales bacterium]
MSCFRLLTVAAVGSGLILLTGWQIIADEGSGPQDADRAAIRAAGKAYVAALRRGDAEALAEHWVPGGVYVNATDRSFDARALIQQQFKAGQPQAGTGGIDVDTESSLRFVTADVAIEEGTSRRVQGAHVVPGRFTAVWVKRGPRWLLDSVRERAPASAASGHPLEALSWMLGEWVGEGGNLSVRWSGVWSENEKFILRRFTIEQAGSVVRRGTQRLGWDAAAGKIRSWTFLSDGTIVEGDWRREDGAWIEKTSGVLSDGKRSAAVNFWVPEGEDRWVLNASHVKVGDAALDNSVVEFQRVRLPR